MRVREKMRDSCSTSNKPATIVCDPGSTTMSSNVPDKISSPVSHASEAADKLQPRALDEHVTEEMDTTSAVSSSHPSEQQGDDTTESLHVVSPSSSDKQDSTPFRDFTTNHEFDICKVKAWKLPTVKRNTKEWIEKQKARGLLRKKRTNRVENTENQRPKRSPPHSNSPPQRKRTTRSFINSNYQSSLIKEHGYDLESNYQRAMSHYDQTHVTDRRGTKK